VTDSVAENLERAVEAAVAAGADDVEVSYEGTELLFLRFASSRFTQVGTSTDEVIRIRALANGRLGSSTTGNAAADTLAAAARNAVEAARSTPPLGLPLSFAGDDDGGRFDDVDLGAPGDPERAPALVRQAFDAAGERDAHCFGALKASRTHRAVRSSSGLSRTASAGAIDFQCIAQTRSGEGSGFACYAGSNPSDLAPDAVATAAADIAAASSAPVDVEPGRYDVVLAPAAVAELLEWMALASFHGLSVLDGTSLLAGRNGERVFDPRISIADDADGGLPFDTEGRPRQPVSLVEGGVAGPPTTDRLAALRLANRGIGDGASTGHACAVDTSDPEPVPGHLAMAAGNATVDDLIAGIDRGIYVTRLHYVNGLLDTRAATMTGMTRDGAFLIEGGKRGAAVHNLRFTDSLLSAWSEERLLGVSAHRQRIPSFWMPAATVLAPAVAVRGFHFTGRSR